MSYHVLIVDDDPAICKLLSKVMISNEMDPLVVNSGAAALDLIARQSNTLDMILMDITLGDMEGFDVIQTIRRNGVTTPVIIISGRNEDYDFMYGLSLGADDYVTKPFSPRELVARVRARLRRAGAVPAASPVSADPWVMRGAFAIDREGHRIRYRQQLLDLTRYEYAVLDALLQRPGAILSRAQLMDRGWDSDADSADRTVDTHVKTLRAKLRAAGADPDPIRTHRGLGYAIEA